MKNSFPPLRNIPRNLTSKSLSEDFHYFHFQIRCTFLDLPIQNLYRYICVYYVHNHFFLAYSNCKEAVAHSLIHRRATLQKEPPSYFTEHQQFNIFNPKMKRLSTLLLLFLSSFYLIIHSYHTTHL